MTIASDCWIELLNSIQAAPEYGIEKATENSPLVMIEYSSPNTNKPLHLVTSVTTCWEMPWQMS